MAIVNSYVKLPEGVCIYIYIYIQTCPEYNIPCYDYDNGICWEDFMGRHGEVFGTKCGWEEVVM